MRLGNRAPYIIAEAGVNHNGSVALAKKLVDVAVNAGADAVKFQTFKTEQIVTREAAQADYQEKNTKKESQFDMLKRLELTEEQFAEIDRYCKHCHIDFLSTPHSGQWSVEVLERLDVVAYKVGSGDLTNTPFLHYLATKGRPIILSTGMGNIDEVKLAVNTIRQAGNDQIVLLQCTSLYPCPPENANIKAMSTLAKIWPEVGFSDHTLGIEAGIISTSLGATVIEKHITLDKSMEGPDHMASLDPNELIEFVRGVRLVAQAGISDPSKALETARQAGLSVNVALLPVLLGAGEKSPFSEETKTAALVRKSLHAACDIRAGTTITDENSAIKRPLGGIEPLDVERAYGKRATRDIKQDEIIQWSDLV